MGIPADYNDASFAARCNFRPPDWIPEPVSMLPIPQDWVATKECVGEQRTKNGMLEILPDIEILPDARKWLEVSFG